MPTSEQERQTLFDEKVAEIEQQLVTAERSLHDLRTWVESYKEASNGYTFKVVRRRRRWWR